ncbi:MAG: 4-hydroxy-tetrahydrodipicolinate reductase [Polyangiales bacterium]
MGRAIVRAITELPDARVHSAVEFPGSPYVGSDAGVLAGIDELGVRITDVLDGLKGADVVIDFTTAKSTPALVALATTLRMPVVIGTTGLDDSTNRGVEALSRVAPVVHAANYSVGVAVLNHLAAEAVRLLGDAYDAEIVEMHHHHKTDAPSGTALALAETVRKAKGFDAESLAFGREGNVGARPRAQIGVMTLRGGDVVGDHTLVLAGGGERLELTHRAHDRSLFARGAVRAAAWVVGRAPGRYAMRDVLGLP